MIKRLVVALMFLTRLRLPGAWNADASDVGRSTMFFPLIGAGIGAVQCGLVAIALRAAEFLSHHSRHPYHFPDAVLAVLIVLSGVLITGALHLDGLADMADGFGGSRSREDVLRIMRDHSIGAYGALALILVLALKMTSIVSLVGSGYACRFLVVAPVLARASIVMLGFLLPYARAQQGGLGSIVEHVGVTEVVVSVLTALAFAIWLGGWRAVAALLTTALISLANAGMCVKRIHGITGDTLGANVEVCEAFILAAGAILSS